MMIQTHSLLAQSVLALTLDDKSATNIGNASTKVHVLIMVDLLEVKVPAAVAWSYTTYAYRDFAEYTELDKWAD